MKIVILDGGSINPGDLSWDKLGKLGDLTVYDSSSYEECFDRMKDAEAVFFSKINMDKKLIMSNPKLKFLGMTATGTDNLDIVTARQQGIACVNVPAYSTDAVAQHTIGLILELSNHIGLHNQSVHSDQWNQSRGFCYWEKPMTLLSGKSLGIIGYGNIGKTVGKIATALGMEINIYSKDKEAALSSDFVTLHIPAVKDTIEFINKERISKMKDGAFLINTARGTLINEKDLAHALTCGKLAGFGADVLNSEPPEANNPLIHLPNCVITPHNAWCPKETRAIVCDVCANNLESFLKGEHLNRIDL